MNNTSINSYYYKLPKEQIAERPLDRRDDSKLLHLDLKNNSRYEKHFSDLLDILNPGDLLILNNTRVIPARINAVKETGGKIELLFNRKISKIKCEAIFSSSRPPKLGSKLSINEKPLFIVTNIDNNILTLKATSTVDIFEIYEEYGEVPLPKYIKRLISYEDKKKYQTVYAKLNGSVAAPTAGLHFTNEMIEKLIKKGINIEYITLHISYNTFKPIKSDNYLDHDLGSEYIHVNEKLFSSINKTKESKKRIVAVGTTVTRAIEFCYSNNILESYEGPADLFIYPGYEFLAINCMITNFHLPKSSLLLLVCAFASKDKILDAYNYAVSNKYRFYSYGDSMFLEK